jgi:hypothetical protein
MTYQKCPICEGIGMIPKPYATTTGFNSDVKCPTCKGARIISSMTGLPPERVVKEVEEREAKERERDKQFTKQLIEAIKQPQPPITLK